MPRTTAPTLTSPIPRIADRDRRRTSASVVLRSVLEHGPVARSTIARPTGLSPASVTDYCARFTELHGSVRRPGPGRRRTGRAAGRGAGHPAARRRLRGRRLGGPGLRDGRRAPAAGLARSITIPPYGGETLIADSAAAYRDLPEPLRKLAGSLEAGGPPSGERGLFIGGFAQRIVGLSVGESRKIIDLLQSYVTRPENILRRRWSPTNW